MHFIYWHYAFYILAHYRDKIVEYSGVENLIRFLGDFHIDEYSNISLSKREIVILSYLLIYNRKIYLSELTDLFILESEIDISYTKKIINNLSKKLESIVAISLSKDYVLTKSKVDVDVLLLEREIEAISKISSNDNNKAYNVEIAKIVKNVLEFYTGHFLPFIDNFWVVAYRNNLKNFLLKFLLKYYYSLESFHEDPYLNIRIAKLLPELYLNHHFSSTIYSFVNNFSSKTLNVGLDMSYIINILSDKTTDTEVVRVKKVNQKIINKLVNTAKEIDLLDDEEFIIYIPKKNLENNNI